MNKIILEKINLFLENSVSLKYLDPNIFDMINEYKVINEISFGDYYLEYISSLPKLDFENAVKISREVYQLFGKENEFDNILKRLKNDCYISMGSLDKNDNDCILKATESRMLLSGTYYDVILLCHEIGHKLRYDDSVNLYDNISESLFFETPSVMLELAANDYLRDVYNINIKADEVRKAHIFGLPKEDNIDNQIFNIIMNLKKLDNFELYNELMKNDSIINYLNGSNVSILECVSEAIEEYSYDIGYILGNYANTCDNKRELLNLFLKFKNKGLSTLFTIDENIIIESLKNSRFVNK